MTHLATAAGIARRKRIVLVGSLTFIVGTALAAAGRGYRDLWVSYDLLPDYQNAANFVETGALPVKGSISGLGAFNPPGYSWFYVPGAWVLPASPGLAGALGSAILFTLTIIGLGLLLGTAFGLLMPIGAAALFSYSNIGTFYASSLWPRAHVCFYCWTVYFLKRWSLDGQRSAFAAALATYLLGLYCFFEIAPLGALFVMAWLIYRPAIAWPPVLACIVVMLLVWSPFLAFEYGRAGADVRTFVSGTSTISQPSGQTTDGLRSEIFRMASFVKGGLSANYRRGVNGFSASVSFFATVLGLAFGTARGQRLVEGAFARSQTGLSESAMQLHRFLALALLVPWCLMLMLVLREPADPSRRFWWFWLFQTYFIAFSTFWIVPRLRLRRPLVVALQCAPLVAAVPLSAVKSNVLAISRSGYGGISERLAAVDYVASSVKASARHQAVIGYELAVPSWQRTNDGHFIFKVGNDYDLVFRRRHHIDNQSTSEIGFSPDDEFRIVELIPTDTVRDLRLHSNDRSQFTEMARFGNYWVGRRADAQR